PTAPPETHTLSLHDALPIYAPVGLAGDVRVDPRLGASLRPRAAHRGAGRGSARARDARAHPGDLRRALSWALRARAAGATRASRRTGRLPARARRRDRGARSAVPARQLRR